MKKKGIMLLVAACSMFFIASADTEVIEGKTWTFVITSGGGVAIVSGPTDVSGHLSIPAMLGDYYVTEIRSGAFRHSDSITSVDIPPYVTRIGTCAFWVCTNLNSVTIPRSVTQIDSGAFGAVVNLKTVTIPGRFPLSVVFPDSYKQIASVTVEEGEERITGGAYRGCSGLQSVSLPQSLTFIGGQAFADCTSLTNIEIPAGVTKIESFAFTGSGLASFTVAPANSAFCSIDGLLCSKDGTKVVCGVNVNGDVTIPAVVSTIGVGAFSRCSGLASVTFPTGLTRIEASAFQDCIELTTVSIPPSITVIDSSAFAGCVNLRRIDLDPDNSKFKIRHGKLESLSGQLAIDCSLLTRILSSQIRENDPTIMDVTYKIRSINPTVKVRVLAFEDGERSFAKVVRPETFVDGTGVNVGDAITPNVEHKISWRVSGDWKTKLAKVKFEVLASEGELLPLETMTIPASDQYGKMKITWNAISDSQVFDALLWLYADKDPGLTLTGGTLKNGTTALASGTQLSGANSYYDENGGWAGDHWVPNSNAPTYVLRKMGYSLLTGVPLTYANQETRLGLKAYGARQYGYKIVE